MREIQLTQGFVAKVDDEDYDLVANRKWHASRDLSGNVYAYSYCKERKQGIPMHRLIMGVKDSSLLIDHIDWDGLNNQKYNLRICNHSVNRRNRRPKDLPYPPAKTSEKQKMTSDFHKQVDEIVMTIINSYEFKEKAKKDAKLRVYLGRIKKGITDLNLKVALLRSFGYDIYVKKPQ